MKEFIKLTLQIPNMRNKDILFHFNSKIKNWAKTMLEWRYVGTIDEAIIQTEALTNFKHDMHDKAKWNGVRTSHSKGGGDHGLGKEKLA